MGYSMGDDDACMANAINNYFHSSIFSSLVDFQTRQRELCRRLDIDVADDFDIALMRCVKIGEHYYRRSTLFDTTWMQIRPWTGYLVRHRRRVLIDYRPRYQTNMHVEYGEFRDDGIVFFTDDGTTMALPECIETVDAYVARTRAPNAPIWRRLSIFNYVRE
jgi:hypothetical protein